MSIQAVAWVFDHSEAEGPARLVLISIASHADSSWCCFPSVPMIAAETRLSERQVYRSIKDLELLGELERSSGGGRGRRNTYRVGHYKRCQDDRVKLDLTLTDSALNPDSAVTHNRKEPSLTTAREREKPWKDPAEDADIPAAVGRSGLAAAKAAMQGAS